MGYIGQAHLRTTLRPRYLMLAVLMGALIASLTAVSTAGAAEIIVSNCSQLQNELNHAEKGDVITLATLCTESNSGTAKGSFMLHSTSDLTIQGQSGTTAGFEGVGVSGPALEGTGNGLVLRNLVVESYSLDEKSAVTLNPGEGALPVIESDRFIDDTDSTSGNSARGGALYIYASNGACAYTAPLSITGSLFQGDRIVDTSTEEHNRDQGGAAYAELRCGAASAPFEFATLSGNTFAEDSISTAAGNEAFGGALYLANRSSAGVLVSATQSGDVFENDSIMSPSPTGVYGGGGEWAPSIDLTSTNDRFIKDSLPGPQGSSAASEGAGLGVNTTKCAGEVNASAVLEDAIVAANSIGAASEDGQSAGAGIYAACVSPEPNGHFHLTLNDSTVSGNQAPNGIAGIDGEDADQLTLSDSIVTGSPGQADVGGFRTVSGGSLTSSFSDVCVPDTSTPLPGQGNICAEPQLTAEGEESPSSPTIDAGSNALVPAALTSDAFGHARILVGHAACGASFPAIVDMGADEFTPGVLSCPAPFTPRPPVPGLTRYIGRKVTSTGLALTLSCVSTDGLGCSGEIFLTTNELLQGKKVIAVGSSTRGSVRLGQAPFALAAGATATFTAKLNSTGLQLLRHFHAISAFLLANEASPTSTPFIFLLDGVRFSEPKKHGSKKHGHKPRHPKPRH
jgi:hypothetical protein